MKKLIVCLLFLALLCGCGKVNTVKSDKISIVTTVFPVYDFVRAVGGDSVDISLLIKPGSEVHSFEPAPSDIAAISNCDLFAFVGGESDNWARTVLSDNKVNNITLIDKVDLKGHRLHDHSSGHSHSYDEHIWTSPKMAADMINAICERLCTLDVYHASEYRQNAAEYIEKINNVAAEIRTVTEKAEKKFILVADRFPFEYFTEYFGIEYMAALDGCAAPSDISLKTMATLVASVEERRIKTVFCTELSNRIIANALTEQSGVRVLELHSAHNVTIGDFRGGITYVDIMKRNAAALKEGMS